MKKYNPYISILFAGVILFGITLSSIHIHFDMFDDVDTEHIVLEEELNCIICGSVLKFNPPAETYSIFCDTSAFSDSAVSTVKAIPPFSNFQEGRSPPLFLNNLI